MQNDSLLTQQLDEYRLIAPLGHGGMARVYLGLDNRLKRYAAIKTIDKPLRAEEDYIKRFEYEAQAIARLEHPHIVRVYRYGESAGTLYLAMQYIKGASLDSVLASYEQEGTFMEPEDILRIIRQLCLALDYAHSKGVIHRDVKPSNIMLDEAGNVFLADFGLSFYREMNTQDEVFGTPRYMAPEQVISSNQVVPQSDLYAVGIILYEMLTGQTPFTAADPLQIARMQLEVQPPRPSIIRPGISPDVEAVIMKALAKEPQDRFVSGAALVQALEIAINKAGLAPAATLRQAPSSQSLPERVTILERPLPTLPAGANPPDPHHTQADVLMLTIPKEASPAAPAPSRRLYVGIGMGLIFLCLLLFLATQGLKNLGAEAANSSTATSGTGISEAEATHTATLEPTPTLAQVRPTATPTPVGTEPATETPLVPTDIPAATATLLPTAISAPEAVYTLLIATNKDDSLFVVNQSDDPFPMASLQLGEGGEAIQGLDWGLTLLESGNCVTAWKDRGNPKPPAVRCERVGESLTRDGPNRFWKNSFAVFYAGMLIDNCQPTLCLIEIVR